jgi:hypothetical protein
MFGTRPSKSSDPENRRFFIRILSITLGSILVAYSIAAMLPAYSEPRKQVLEQSGSRFLLGDEELQVRRAYTAIGKGDTSGLAESIRIFSALLARNPASPYRWCDLGDAFLEAGEVDKARYCFSRARELGPRIAPILIRLVNFHFRLGETTAALPIMTQILDQIPEFDQLIFSYYTRMGFSLEEILDHGMPPNPRVARSYFRHLLQAGSAADLEQAWIWMGSHNFADESLTCEYVSALVGKRKYQESADIWSRFLGPRKRDYGTTNYLFNGDFESEPAKCGLDWQTSERPDVEVKRESTVAHSGKWSLRIRFQPEENLNYGNFSQTAYVRPGRVRFRAYLRTSDITTDKGVGFHIFDPESSARLDVVTEQFTGTSDWQSVEKTFVVPRETRVLAVQVIRQPSQKFDYKIRGTIWIDDVSLVGLTPLGPEHK